MAIRLLRRQPFKALYLTYQFFSTLFVRIPLWITLAVPRSWRPRATWSIRRTVQVRLTRHVTRFTGICGPLSKLPNHLAITPGVNVNGVWIPPVPEFVKDELQVWANIAHVTPVRIPGYWIHKEASNIPIAASPMPGEKVVYALHGGGYATLSAHPTDPTALIARGLLEHVDSVHRVFSPEYRLSSGRGQDAVNSFPAALIDALAGYSYLVNAVGFDASDIIVEGDSAGGNLAHALTRYLVEHPNAGLPAPPGALILLSPWIDLSFHHPPTSSFVTNIKSDYIGGDIAKYSLTVGAFVGPHGLGAAEVNRYVSPGSPNIALKIDFKGFPRTFITAGGAEILYDAICRMKERMVHDLGEGDGVQPEAGKVKFHVQPDATHDWVPLKFHEPERTETLKAIAQWVAAS